MINSREFYCAPSGGRWLLAQERETGYIFVRHEAGGISHIEIATFLRPGNLQPEHAALRALLATLISGPINPAS